MPNIELFPGQLHPAVIVVRNAGENNRGVGTKKVKIFRQIRAYPLVQTGCGTFDDVKYVVRISEQRLLRCLVW